jgi:hypothetical protein
MDVTQVHQYQCGFTTNGYFFVNDDVILAHLFSIEW